MNYSLLVIRNQLACYCGAKDGGEFDLKGACPKCGTGARRIEPIKLPLARLRDRVSITLKFEVIIPPRLAPAIRSAAPRALREIRDEKTDAATPHFELIAQAELPKFGSGTTGFTTEMQCPICKRDGYFNVPNVPLQLRYDRPPPKFPVTETWERFGNSRLAPVYRESLFAVPYLILDETVSNALREERGVEFVPVDFRYDRV